jgi:hypothetical protein
VARLGSLLLFVACSTGCWNSRDGLRADWGKGGGSLFDRGNAQAKARDRATNDSLDPADDVFLGRNRTQVADAGGKRTDEPRRAPRATDDDGSVLMEASSKESSRPRGRMIEDDDPSPRPAKGGSALEQTAEYKRIRSRLEAIKASWSSEKLSGGNGFMVRCEVPHPTDPELAQVFEAKSGDELSALRAAVVQAEKWRAGVRRRFDPAEADLDPFAP